MKKLGTLLSVMALLCVVGLIVSTDVRAQSFVPCCEGGAKPNKKCGDDGDCPGVCLGGFKDGRQCRDDADCAPACVGGFDDGKRCQADTDCASACVGGRKDGRRCSDDSDCPGGSCADAGSCGDRGDCTPGACTGLCPKKKPKKSPSDLTAQWVDFLDTPDSGGSSGSEVSARPACP